MKLKYLSVVIATMFSAVGTVSAQQAAPASNAPGASEKLDTVTVTARRREELIQDVPGAVTAFSATTLDKLAIPDITALTDLTPNTTLKASRATNSTLTAFIRGIGQQDPVAGYEQGVGIYLDDVYLARPQGTLADIYDLERIEVLRGPQGTLYGRNTIGGAIKYVTRKLADKPTATLKATIGDYSERDFVVKASVPVTDKLKVGASAASFQRSGFGKNTVNGLDNYNKDVTAGRISAEYSPTTSLFIRFAVDRTVDNSLPKQGYRLTAGPAPTNEPVLENKYDTRSNLYTVLGHAQQVTSGGNSLLVDWAITPDLSFKSITANRSDRSYAPIDFDSLNSSQFEAPAIYTNKQASQEFQFTYTGSRWQGVAGLFYMRANAFNEFDVLYNAAGGLSLYTKDDIDSKTWAAFADVSFNVTDAFSVNIGGRQTSDHREASIYKRNYLGLTGSPTLGNPAAVGLAVNTDMSKAELNRTDSKFTPKIGFGLKLAPTQNLYGSYSEGFKGGMFDPRMDLGGTPTSALALVKRKGVEPEEVKTFEMGLKSSFNGGRVQTNAAVFFTDYANVQIPGSVPTYDAGGNVNGFAGNVTNAGKAKIKGLEFEIVARVTDAFTLSGMFGFTDAKYKQWLVANGLAGSAAALINIAGSAEFQNTPKHSANLIGTYEWAYSLMGTAGTLALTNNVSYKGKVHQTEIVRPTGIAATDVLIPANLMLSQEGYGLWDAGLQWTSKDRNVQLALNGRNLTDKRYKVAGYNFSGFFNTVTAFYGEPRTLKASVTLKF